MTRRFRIPFRIPFRGLRYRYGSLFRGPQGWAEYSPFPWYGPRETETWKRAAEEAAATPWPAPVRSWVPVNVTVPDCDPVTAHSLVTSSGCTTAKVKVGTEGDAARVEAVRDALGPGGKLRLDANAAWTVDEAVRKINALARFELEYVEQPVQTIEEMAVLRRRVDVPLAIDEAARTLEGARRAGRTNAADVIVVKVQPMGGVWAGLRAVEASGLPPVVSSAVETSVGLAAGVALAAALPELPYACGLGTLLLLEGDVVDRPLLPVHGEVEVRRPAVDEAALARWEVTG